MKKVLIAFIKFYRLTLSPFIGRQCRFYPSCSYYGEEAILRFGACKGSWLTFKRIIRCGPWCAGGYDPVPEKFENKHEK